jgi:hypothetical protein
MIKKEIKKGELRTVDQICKVIRPLIDMDDYNFFPNLTNTNLIELIPEIGAA